MRKIVEISDVGVRLDVFAQNMGGLTRNATQKLIDAGDVNVNNKASKANYRLRVNDVVEMSLPEVAPLDYAPQNIPLDIVFEDSDLIVINKPKDMVVHPAAGHTEGTLVNALLFHCGDSLSGINGIARPGIVHRIDKDTSGLLVVAKNDATHRGLAQQFADHTVKREYVAIVHGRVKQNGTVDAPIARHKVNRKKMAIDLSGRRAVTHYTVVEQFKNFTQITARLETGRTHQIRVHMASLSHPVLGDTVYSNAKETFGLEGQALHARTLGFDHPTTGKQMQFEAPMPEYFEKTLTKIRRMI
ncbi:MAG: RluA family pseudouridine synthase [Defluviitaleaceae bacterium]|nr:RluA family pseudouridine synthase [Defluviitaleaceae bacterium]